MMWIRTVVLEIFGLFVDDGSFALAILAWVALLWLLLHGLHLATLSGFVLFAGLAVILLLSVLRFSQKHKS